MAIFWRMRPHSVSTSLPCFPWPPCPWCFPGRALFLLGAALSLSVTQLPTRACIPARILFVPSSISGHARAQPEGAGGRGRDGWGPAVVCPCSAPSSSPQRPAAAQLGVSSVHLQLVESPLLTHGAQIFIGHGASSSPPPVPRSMALGCFYSLPCSPMEAAPLPRFSLRRVPSSRARAQPHASAPAQPPAHVFPQPWRASPSLVSMEILLWLLHLDQGRSVCMTLGSCVPWICGAPASAPFFPCSLQTAEQLGAKLPRVRTQPESLPPVQLPVASLAGDGRADRWQLSILWLCSLLALWRAPCFILAMDTILHAHAGCCHLCQFAKLVALYMSAFRDRGH
ncbi:uncharacterized protein LOC100193060 [Zea mays]|jgi:hypothetical protein|uniref:Uncharacterized protein n=1 Tax=Zea mays TaxID=4577 RepID=B4FDM8_MAIZE|nr:uncharacterized protein LOC100193060 [Zea mays]ACF80221.1 unknown [Zea mays]|eukprot:NP_001131699.1 uncharacterized protein LOC100193060 [Zea mays]